VGSTLRYHLCNRRRIQHFCTLVDLASNSTKFVPMSRWWRIPNVLHTYDSSEELPEGALAIYKVIPMENRGLVRERWRPPADNLRIPFRIGNPWQPAQGSSEIGRHLPAEKCKRVAHPLGGDPPRLTLHDIGFTRSHTNICIFTQTWGCIS
jgi:hypothetical protein